MQTESQVIHMRRHLKLPKWYSPTQVRRDIAWLLCCTILGTQTNIIQASAELGSLLEKQMSEWSDGVRSHRATDSDLNESVLTGTDDEWENDISNVRSKIGGGRYFPGPSIEHLGCLCF